MPVASPDRPPLAGGPPGNPGRIGGTALVLIAVSVLLQVVVGHLGPSVAVPPVSVAQDRVAPADPWLVTLLLTASLVLGALGLLFGLRALRAGWQPSPVRLLAGAAVAVLLLLLGPPLGTADLGGYAAYGRMAVLDRDPYSTTPRDLAGDPVADAAEAPWRDIPSIYGPVATGEFRVAAALGGTSREAVLRLLQGAAAAAFLATALLLDRRTARDGPAARRRAVLLWALNPLLLHQLVAGGHLDALLALLVAAGVALLVTGRQERLAGSWSASAASGVVLGVAGLVKATAAAPAAGLAVAHLLRPPGSGPVGHPRRRFGAFVVAGVTVAAVGYETVGGLSALTPTRDAGRFVSRGTPWRFVASGLERVLPHDLARTAVGLLAVVVAAWLSRRLFRALPSGPLALRAALASSTAWLVVAPYALPWYDAIAWALLALVVVRADEGERAVLGLERLLLLHTAFLSVAYLPGRVVGLPHSIVLAQDVVRGALAPMVVLAVVIGLAMLKSAPALATDPTAPENPVAPTAPGSPTPGSAAGPRR